MDAHKLSLLLLLVLVVGNSADNHPMGKWAKCEVEKNIAGRPIEGVVFLHQKMEGQETVLNISLHSFNEEDEYTEHGFHIHQEGDLGDNCKNALGHYNPAGVDHGGPDDEVRHIGDLGNVEEKDGKVMTIIKDKKVSLFGEETVIGRAIVVHLKKDDLGKGGDEGSRTTGNAGERIACCKIEEYEPPKPPKTTTEKPDCQPGMECADAGSTLKSQFFSLLAFVVALLLY